MLKQLRATGILGAFSVFGIKAGLGLGAQLIGSNVPLVRKLLFISGSLAIYLILFSCLYVITAQFDLLNFLDHIINVLRYGMGLHLIVALGLFLWGVKLLLQKGKNRTLTDRNYHLTIQCPC